MISLLRILVLLAQTAVPLAAFVTGVRSTDPFWLWKRPRLLARSVLVILIGIPLLEILLAEILSPFNLAVRAGIAVAILSVGIGPPDLMKRTRVPHDVASYEVGLDVTLMTLAIFYLPVAVRVHGAVFGHDLSLAWWDVAKVVLVEAVLPFFAGVAAARWFPKLASPIERRATALVVVPTTIVTVVALVASGRSLFALGIRAWLVCMTTAVMAVAIGHVAGGPTRETRSVLASYGAIRFPALAVLLTTLHPRGPLLIPAILAYLISSALVVAVYRAAMARTERRPVALLQ